jgi:hypothetical protein
MAVAHASFGRMPAAVLAALLFGLLAHPAPDGLAMDVVAIDGTPYSEVDLTGYTKAVMEGAFLAELAKLPDKDFGALLEASGMDLDEPGKDAPVVRVVQAERRKQAAAKLFNGLYANFLRSAADAAVLSKAFDRLVESHGLPVPDYVDIDALEGARMRHARCWQFVSENRTGETVRAAVVYEEARAKYGLTMGQAEFEELRPGGTRAWLPSSLWPTQCTLNGKRYRAAVTKSAALGYLVQPTCAAGGFYHAKATLAWRAMRAGPQTIAISGFAGDPSVLNDFLRAGDKAGGVGMGFAFARFKTLCAAAGMPVEELHKPLMLPDFRRAVLAGPVPPLGVFTLGDDGAWRAILPPDPEQPQLADAALESFVIEFAMEMAVRPYLPTALGFPPHYSLSLDRVLGSAGSARNPLGRLAPGMESREKPFLKPYPDAPFREYAESRAWSQTWYARLAASVAGADAAQQNALLDELVKHAGSRKTMAGRRLAEKTLDGAVAHGDWTMR